MSKKRYSLWMLFILFIPLCAFSQDLVLEPYTVSAQYLNAQINADTGSAEFKAGTRVYVLKRDGIYLSNAILVLSGSGKKLNIRSENSTGHYPPTIFLYPTTAGTGNPPGWFADLASNTLWMDGVMLSGYYEPIDTCLDRIQGGLIRLNTSGSGGSVYINNCILKSINGQLIRTEGKPKTISVTNTICADMGFEGTSNFGAGKLVDLRDQDVDTCRIENCTIVNFEDRIIRHYQSTKGPIHNLYFNHNTIVNGVSYHGMLSLGRVDSSGTGLLQIKNNLFVDPFALGADTCAIRQAEFGDGGELDATNNLPRITWTIANKNLVANWDITDNYYTISDSGQAMLNLPLPNGPYYQNEGPPLTLGINARLAALGKDTTIAFRKINARLTNTPQLMTTMIRWIYRPRSEGGDGKEKNNNDPNFTKLAGGNWAYDYNRHKVEYYFDTLNCNITSDVDLAHAASDGTIIGDPRWTSTLIPVVAFSAAPKSINFDSVKVNSTKKDTIVVSCTGNSALVIDSVKSTSAGFTVTPTNGSVPNGSSANFVVTFAPTSIGQKSASIIFYHNGSSGQDTILVSGVGKSTVGVETAEAAIPTEFQLYNNYPNPFNPSTTIRFDLPQKSRVILKIYSLLGQEITVLANEIMNAGYCQIVWNTMDVNKVHVAGGVYFYRLIAQPIEKGSTFMQTKKMLLMK